MATAPVSDTRHTFTRAGRTIPVEVLEIQSRGDGGHALIFGKIGDDCLVRIHSRCLYGDALSSQDCDCGYELSAAMDMIQAAGSGVLVYLEQEGRGAGLVAKARGYQVSQRSGIDTFASYARLGYNPDTRTYCAAAATLQNLGLRRIRLLTNNPEKVAAVRTVGITVEQLPLRMVPQNRAAEAYLEAKRRYRGHLLPQHWWIYRMVNVLVLMVVIVTLTSCYLAVAEVAAFEQFMFITTVLAASVWGWPRTRFVRARIRLLGSRFTRFQPNSTTVDDNTRP
ncbi:GTP cyclohydrolase II RibA [Nocardia sp. SYP-A9097]|uniref:GTP cyclohydrolase II n=1 Tax=Nocardia sp. SYP-A9097 TaxID=2663237 RepID=UPI00129A6DD9|nr:GTP cyclohydrolase II [Nocardia sp. SYP-A9097]MRH90195.1 GTP cyclohydrolase II RibA [Nocardia sp. SYP-A9097]